MNCGSRTEPWGTQQSGRHCRKFHHRLSADKMDCCVTRPLLDTHTLLEARNYWLIQSRLASLTYSHGIRVLFLASRHESCEETEDWLMQTGRQPGLHLYLLPHHCWNSMDGERHVSPAAVPSSYREGSRNQTFHLHAKSQLSHSHFTSYFMN